MKNDDVKNNEVDSTPKYTLAPDKTIFFGNRDPHPGTEQLPLAPPWRRFDKKSREARAATYCASDREIIAVNTALYLRRPLLITGRPGTGKTSLAYAVARELMLEPVFVWPVTSRTTLQNGLYHYDALARLQDSRPAADGEHPANDEAPYIGKYIRLGPVGAALCCSRPKKPSVLLIDEIDKSDIDLPNDLLHIFEEGEFEIPELVRLPDDKQHSVINVGLPKGKETVPVERGRIRCAEFPIVFMTSNGERDFPPAFLRRCLRLDIPLPDNKELAEIVKRHLKIDINENKPLKQLLDNFVKERDEGKRQLATDQLLNAVRLVQQGLFPADSPDLAAYVLRDLETAS